ncbi:MAG: glycosyltransferase family 4 protein [Anaerolineae bacterium]|nr:glycosyltransferase family 4 protein [Anaerolineae bacterium]
MRVMMMVSGLPIRGAERNMVNVLPVMQQAGVDVVLGTLNTRRDGPLAEVFAQTGIERLDMGARRMLDPAAWQRFTAALRARQIDLVHAQDQDTIIYAAAAHLRLGMPAVMTRHVLFEPATGIKTWARARLVLLAARYGFDRIVAVSEAVREQFAALAGLPPARIQTIYNGLDMEHFLAAEDRAALRARFGWGAEEQVVLLIAALDEGKGHDVLLRAIPAVQAARPDARFKLVGRGPLEATLRAQIAPFGPAVELLGQRTDVPALLAAADAVVQTSWAEALPTVLIEAGASALPVVATDVGGSAEIVADGETGYIVPPGDAAQVAGRLVALLEDPAGAAAMGQRARARVLAMFSLPEQVRQTVALYESVLAAPRARKG